MADKSVQTESLRVLLVEDNGDDEFLAIWALKQAGIEQIAVARDGREALERLYGAEPFPGLLVLDLSLPKIDGREVLRRVREDVRTMNLPILILTSSEDRGDKDVCRRHGIIDYVSKPLTAGVVKRLLSMIET
jgi:CheY-like chemotaxis protein